ncbi:MAG: tRNA pseudouridine(38-40) synthase TruA [Candidatus Latescibacteria bacterium]|nr:tRNA pseudouridine(38-40) synthase TruA [bacterium]MBD3422810.1 tRNA pseudouridine(38-40) synthase TruA [Candidatus Latescibacterota bacterium]
MPNIKLTIEYDGSGFRGWQVQPGQRTVQGEIERAVRKITGEFSRVTGAGRTDTGVHAAGQVASVQMETGYPPEVIRRALNGNLPRDIRVRKAEKARPRFNARYDACSRTYHYIFFRGETALWRNYFFPTTFPLDLDAMRTGASELAGKNDFSSFVTSAGVQDTTCRVISCSIIPTPPLLTISVKADRFLYNMVRAIAGTLFNIGRGKGLGMKEILGARDRRAAGTNLPASALYLMEVRYRPPGA